MKKKLISVVLALVTVFSVMSVAFITTQAADFYVRTGAYYTIKNKGSNKMLNVYGSRNKSNTNVTVYAADKTSGQDFKLKRNGSGYILVPRCATSCALNVYGTSAKNNANVNIWTKSGSDTQRWIIKYNSKLGGFVICCANNTNYVLTATGSANSSNVCLKKYDSSNKYQVWTSSAFVNDVEKADNNTTTNNNSITKYTLCWPVSTSVKGIGKISSAFGPRKAPVAGASTNHRGIDISVASGTAIYAAADGVVTKVGSTNYRGNYVIIYHKSIGLSTLYQHLKSYSVKVGDTVEAGEQIAKSGSTGIGSGPHLHYGVMVGKATKPDHDQTGYKMAINPLSSDITYKNYNQF